MLWISIKWSGNRALCKEAGGGRGKVTFIKIFSNMTFKYFQPQNITCFGYFPGLWCSTWCLVDGYLYARFETGGQYNWGSLLCLLVQSWWMTAALSCHKYTAQGIQSQNSSLSLCIFGIRELGSQQSALCNIEWTSLILAVCVFHPRNGRRENREGREGILPSK